MIVTMQADFVARGGDGADDIGMVFDHPPDHEENRARLMPRKLRED